MIAIDATGEGEPLVLLHGLGASRAVWRRVAPALAGERRVLAPDLPGFGDSAPAATGFDLDGGGGRSRDALAERAGGPFDLARDLARGRGRASRSRGAHPDLVRRLVLAAPAGFSPRPWPLAAVAGRARPTRRWPSRRIVGAPVGGQRRRARRALLWGAVAEPQRLSARDARAMLQASRGSTRIGAALTAVLRADLRPHLVRARGAARPDLGRARPGRPDLDARVDPRAAPGRASSRRSPRAAHVPQLERPVEFVAALRRAERARARLVRDRKQFRHNSPRGARLTWLCRDIEPDRRPQRSGPLVPSGCRTGARSLFSAPVPRMASRRLLPWRDRLAAVAHARARRGDRAAWDPLPGREPARVRRLRPEPGPDRARLRPRPRRRDERPRPRPILGRRRLGGRALRAGVRLGARRTAGRPGGGQPARPAGRPRARARASLPGRRWLPFGSGRVLGPRSPTSACARSGSRRRRPPRR